MRCVDCGVLQIPVPWAEPNSRFTALFEAVVIDWLREASTAAVARQLNLSWDEASGIMERAVERGKRRKARKTIRSVGVDETSFRGGHDYVTVVSDQEENSLEYVAQGCSGESLDGFFTGLDEEQLDAIESVSMDMSKAYISSTRKNLPQAERKISFDKFHVAKHLGDAVNKVRRKEHQKLLKEGDESLTGSKYFWLRNPKHMDPFALEVLEVLKRISLRTSRAWAIRQMAMELWGYARRGWAEKAWKRWLSWAMRCRLEPVKKVAKMIRDHLWGILNAIVHRATNAGAESINAKIQRIKRRACGFRNRERFRNAIYFHLGNLDLYPAGVSTNHTDS